MSFIKQKNHTEHCLITASSKNPTEIDMSDIILKFIGNLLTDAPTEKAKENIIGTAIVAWNIAILPEKDRQKNINYIMEKVCAITSSEQDKENYKTLLLMFVEKKLKDYPHINQIISSYNILKKSMEMSIKLSIE